MKRICFVLTWLLTGFSIAANTGCPKKVFMVAAADSPGNAFVCMENAVEERSAILDNPCNTGEIKYRNSGLATD